MIKKFFDKFKKKGVDPKSILIANYNEIKGFESAMNTRRAAMLTVLQITGWSAQKANKILGARFFEEPRPPEPEPKEHKENASHDSDDTFVEPEPTMEG